MATGSAMPTTARCGCRAPCRPAGHRTRWAAGPGCRPGAGPGSTPRPGALRRSTTAAGCAMAGIGPGRPGPGARGCATHRRSAPGSAGRQSASRCRSAATARRRPASWCRQCRWWWCGPTTRTTVRPRWWWRRGRAGTRPIRCRPGAGTTAVMTDAMSAAVTCGTTAVMPGLTTAAMAGRTTAAMAGRTTAAMTAGTTGVVSTGPRRASHRRWCRWCSRPRCRA